MSAAPFWSSRDERIVLHHGDCLDVLRTLVADSIDAMVTDPPAGIGFMGKTWDHHKGGREAWIAWLASVLAECYRVLKPGAHALVWALPRTSHWTGAAIEDAGFEVRDCLSHVFGSGFPKSLNLPGGIGTALKPSHEMWWLARKPLIGTVAANVAQHGTGAINVDACRVGTSKSVPGSLPSKTGLDGFGERDGRAGISAEDSGRNPNVGRWPPNLLLSHSAGCVRVGDRKVKSAPHGPNAGNSDATLGVLNDDGWRPKPRAVQEYAPDGTETVPAYDCAADCPVAMMDRQSGTLTSGPWDGKRNTPKTTDVFGVFESRNETPRAGSIGGASRFFPTFDAEPFFYQAKPDNAEREAGLEHRQRRRVTSKVNKANGTGERFDGGPTATRANTHPTVKPIALMRWLVRLITPRDGVVLDPFAGSGTTLVAACQENVRAIGVEREAEYASIARDRVIGDAPLLTGGAA